MNKLILRLKFNNTNEVIDVIFDTRLTFKENLWLLKETANIEDNVEVYDQNNKCFVKKDKELLGFCYTNFYELWIYTLERRVYNDNR